MANEKKIKKPKLWNIAILSGILVIVLFLMIIGRDNVPAIPVCITLCVYLLLVIACLVYAFFRQLKYNLYSYNTAYYFGFGIYVILLLFTYGIITVEAIMSLESVDLLQVIISLPLSTNIYILLSLIFLLVFSVALLVSNIILLQKKGSNIVYYLGIIISIAIIAVVSLLVLVNGIMITSILANILLIVLYAFLIYSGCMILGALVASKLAASKKPPYDRDFIIILGCGINEDGTPSPILAQRLKAAIAFYHEQIENTGKVPLLIPSGGKGSEKRLSESESMTQYLLTKGIPAEHIIKEDQSTTTYENFIFSKKIISERCPEAKVSYVTANYHVYRSGIMAGHAGIKSIGIGAKIYWYFWPNALMREFIGLLSSHIGKQILIFIGILAFYCLPIFLSWLASII